MRRAFLVLLSVLLAFFVSENFLGWKDFPLASSAELRELQKDLAQDELLRTANVTAQSGFWYNTQSDSRITVTEERCRVVGPEQLPPMDESLPSIEDIRRNPQRYAAQIEPWAGYKMPIKAHREGRRTLVLVGCSYAFGAQLDDEDTFAWRLHNSSPLVAVRNMAQSGAGTYTSLLQAERALDREHCDLLMYAFMSCHLFRNLANYNFNYGLGNDCWAVHLELPPGGLKAPAQGYDEFDDSWEVVEASPVIWPGMGMFRVINLCKRAWVFLSLEEKKLHKEREYQVFRSLVARMRRQAEAGGAEFVLLNLDCTAEEMDTILGNSACSYNRIEAFYEPFCRQPELCSTPDGHPDATVNRYWASLLETWLENHARRGRHEI